MMVLDGKAQLAFDCEKLLDVVVHPTTIKNLNILEGTSPDVFSATLHSINTKGSKGKDEYFPAQARICTYSCSVIHEALVSLGKSKLTISARLDVVRAIAKNPNAIIEDVKWHSDFATPGTLLNDAVLNFTAMVSLPDETRGGVLSTVESWFNPLLQSKELRAWADCDTSDIDIADILIGKKIGFSLPESEFPVAGVIITTLMKARLYQLIQLRGDDRGTADKPRAKVFLIVDECQKVMDEYDLAILPIARSLDLICVFATQNIDGIDAIFQKEKTLQILDSFRSVISFKSSEATMQWIRERIGKIHRLSRTRFTNSVDIAGTNQIAMANGLYDINNENRLLARRHAEKIINHENRYVLSSLRTLFVDLPPTTGEKRPDTNSVSYKWDEEARSIFGPTEEQELNQQFTAVAVVDRAGTQRRDIIFTSPLNNKFEPFLNKEDTPEFKAEQEKLLLTATEDELVKDFLK